MTGDARPGRATDARLAWEVALDRLELDLITAERLLRSGRLPTPEPWDVPTVDGPIPAGLLQRAVEIQRRQAAVQASLREALTSTSKHRAFADRVTSKSVNGLIAPAYVDLTA